MSIVEVIKNQNFFKKLEEKFHNNKFSNSVMFFCEDENTSEVVLLLVALMLNYPTYQLFDEKSAQYQKILKDADLDVKVYPKNKEKLLVSDSNEIVEETFVKPVNRENKIFIIKNIDKSTEQAQNKLLKVLEEPPKNVHFVLCISNMANTLATLRSRAYTLQLRPLTVREVKEILDKKYPNATDSERKIALRICTTYEQVQDLFKQDVEELVEFVEKVVDNVASVTVTNALKILLSLKFKEDDKGKYNPILFLNLYAETLTDRFLDEYISVDEYQNAMNSVLELRTELRVNAINSKNLFELWLLEQWQILGGENIE